jgi:hypothetical protein
MAGKITVSTINDSSGVLATQNGMTGIAKAWVQYNGSTGAVNGAFNVSSVTRNGTGNYTVNFTTAMSNANYAWAIGYNVNPGSGQRNLGYFEAETLSTSSIQIFQTDSGGNAWDITATAVTILGS